MTGFALLITDHSANFADLAWYARGLPVHTKAPDRITPHTWTTATLVFVDAQSAPVLHARPEPLPTRTGVTLLAGPDQADEPHMVRHAMTVGAERVAAFPDHARVVREQVAARAGTWSRGVVIVDPSPTGRSGTITTASLAFAGVAAGVATGVIDARPSEVGLHAALTHADLDQPVRSSGSLTTWFPVDGASAPREVLRHMVAERANWNALTLIHVDHHHLDVPPVLAGADVVVIPVAARNVAHESTRNVVAAVRQHTAAVHVHVSGHERDGDVAAALAAGISAGYPSMSGIALRQHQHGMPQVSHGENRSQLWEAITRDRAPSPSSTVPTTRTAVGWH